MQNIVKSLLILCVLAMFIGCGNPKVTGKVVFSDDGTPLTQGTVFFQKDNEASRGEIQKDGSYSIGSDSTDDGLPPGTYKVYIKNSQLNTAKPGQLPIFENVIDSKYEDPNSSGVTVEVKKTQKYDLKLDRYQGKNKGKK